MKKKEAKKKSTRKINKTILPELQDFYQAMTVEERKQLCADLGICYEYIPHIYKGRRRAGATLALKLQKFSNGAITAASIRPDIFGGVDL